MLEPGRYGTRVNAGTLSKHETWSQIQERWDEIKEDEDLLKAYEVAAEDKRKAKEVDSQKTDAKVVRKDITLVEKELGKIVRAWSTKTRRSAYRIYSSKAFTFALAPSSSSSAPRA